MRFAPWICVALTVAFAGSAAAQTVYRWVDSQGNVHFSDTPPNEQVKNITQKRISTGEVDASQLPYATQVAMKRNPVTLYTAPQCGDPCSGGRTLLSERGIPYTEKDAQSNAADGETVKKLTGATQVPVLVLGEANVKGFDADSWHAALDAAGYPRTRLPGSLAPKPVTPTDEGTAERK